MKVGMYLYLVGFVYHQKNRISSLTNYYTILQNFVLFLSSVAESFMIICRMRVIFCSCCPLIPDQPRIIHESSEKKKQFCWHHWFDWLLRIRKWVFSHEEQFFGPILFFCAATITNSFRLLNRSVQAMPNNLEMFT